MNRSIKVIFIFILIATVYSTFLISSSLKIGKVYRKIEQKELFEKKQDIPKIYLTGNITNMYKQTGERKVKIKYTSTNNTFEKYATIKVQGNSSAYYEKKNYTIKFFNDETYLKKFKINLGWGNESKYVLKANWVDKTHTRNIVSANIISQVQKKYNLFMDTPNNGMIDGYPVEVYINNDFHGLYTLNIPKDEWLFNMDDKNPNHIMFVSEGWKATNMFREFANFYDWECQVGEQTEETLDKFNRLIEFVMNSTDKEFKDNIHNYINIDAAINYYILTQTLHISDNVGKNIIMITYDGKIWYPSLYDLDTAFGTYFNGEEEFLYDSLLNMESNNLFKRLNDNFSNEIADRYFELREDILTEKNINNEIDNFYNSIPKDSLKKEKNKWGENIPGFEVAQMKNFIKSRLPIIDNYMKEKYTQSKMCINNNSTYCNEFNKKEKV